RCPNIHNRWRQRGAGKSSIGSMYYSKCHGELPFLAFSGFRNCHAPSVLLLLLVAEGIDGFAKGSVNFTIGKLIDELKAFERFVRLVGGRRNIHVWILALGLILSTVAGAFKLIAWWEAVTAAVHLARVAWALWALRTQSAPR